MGGATRAGRALGSAALLALLAACTAGSGGGGPHHVSGTVRNAAGVPVAGATVFLVPAGDVDTTPITGQSVRTGAAEAHDEPLEDLVAAAAAAAYPQAVTDASGRYKVSKVPDGTYYFFVQPADGEHLPGGSRSRRAVSADSFRGTTVDLRVSSSPPAGSTTLGSTACLSCHPDKAGARRTGHFLPLRVPATYSLLQDPTDYPDLDAILAYFPIASSFAGGTTLHYWDFDPSRGFDKFVVTLDDPPASPAVTTEYLRAHLWRDSANGQYKVTLENLVNPADPGSPRTFTVQLVHGGIWKTRLLLAVPGRKGRYPFLQFQPEGSEAYYDRTRKTFRDYRGDAFWNDATQTLQNPPVNRVWEGNCAACHYNGASFSQDAGTGEWLADAVDDVGGAFDVDADGSTDEIGVGCAVCHGAGSAHAAAQQARFIVSPQYLSASREAMLCGRCHDRPLGVPAGPSNSQPLNASNEMAPPGLSRAEWLAAYVDPAQKGPAPADLWVDDLHSKSHHQQYSDLLKSLKHRNARGLVTCSDCHTSHGEGAYRYGLVGDPDDSTGFLCLQCHVTEVVSHMVFETGSAMNGQMARCIDCHQPRTAKNGAGHYGFLLGAPTGSPADEGIVYWQNDLASHVFDMPTKFNPGVVGTPPGQAMPVGYTSSCGICHDPSSLPFLTLQAGR